MISSRTIRRGAVVLCAAVATGVSAPSLALAAGGSSAGDQQYVDPLSGSNTSSGSSPSSPAQSSAPAASLSSSPASSSSAGGSGTVTSSGSTGSSSAGVSTGTTSTGRSLPFTGYDGGLAASIGVGLAGAGLLLRRRRSAPTD